MAVNRVLVLYRGSLFAQGVESLLRGAREVEVFGFDLDHCDVRGLIETYRPGVIVLDANDERMRRMLTIPGLLDCVSDLKVVCLDVNNERASVYHKKEMPVDGLNDLLQVILTE